MLLLLPVSLQADLPEPAFDFLVNNCLDCHDAFEQKGDLDLEDMAFEFDLSDPEVFSQWVLAYDRAKKGEMPPKSEPRPDLEELEQFLAEMRTLLKKADRDRIEENGRASVRRLNRFEYENKLREVLDAPWLQVADRMPEDGTAHLFNKIGNRLDVSHVQMMKYLETGEYAIRKALDAALHPTKMEKYYARDEHVMQRYFHYRFGQQSATRSAVPLLGLEPELEIIRKNQPYSVGDANPDIREKESVGFFSGTYAATTKYDFWKLNVHTDGRYRLRFKTYTFTAGLNGRNGGDDNGLTSGNPAWHRPDRTTIMPGYRTEPVTVYSLQRSGDSRWLGTFDSLPQADVAEMEVLLKKDEKIRPDAGRLVRTRPGWDTNPNATDEHGVPGFALQWLEVEGPLYEAWPPLSYQAVVGEMAFAKGKDGSIVLKPKNPDHDAKKVLEQFMARSQGKKEIAPEAVEPYYGIYRQAIELGSSYTDALIAALASTMCSPDFLYLEAQPGALKQQELAERLAYFLWNSPPDRELLFDADLTNSEVLKEQTRRMLEDPRSDRFLNQFLDYWLDLKEIKTNLPDAQLYPDYYLDDQLSEASVIETRKFFRELVDLNLPARNIVDSDFTYVNERLGKHYGFDVEEGVELKRFEIPEDSPRGGILTQASVLTVTANGTTTSPVLRGAWITERILGVHIPPPPSGIEAVEPDTRGATTIREQLEMHTSNPSCYACHAKFDPAGFALESFDVVGGWRDRYRAIGDIGELAEGVGKNGHSFKFRFAVEVDPSGTLEDGSSFEDIYGFKEILLEDERAIARNLANRLMVYATGADISFTDREKIEEVLDFSEPSEYGVRSLIEGVVVSELFNIK